MANRFFNPDEQFCDSTGLPYAGGSLAFYASGTSTPLNTYSDSGLSIANTNQVVLDSAGRSGSIFLQNLAYKVVLSDVNNNQIWTEDPVYASDYSTRAKLTTGSGSPNGNTAGTAGSAGIGADTYWDSTNLILYVCTTTGNAASAVWTAVNSSTAAAVVIPPQGYLTPTSGTPIITADVIGNPSLVYTPYVGNLVPIYSGTAFVPTVFSELTLTLTSSQAANGIYDVFIFNNAGVLTLVTGPAWSSATPPSCSRGAPTALARLSGIWVNNISISGKNGANTYTIPANQATYLGSIYIDGTAGQITCHRSYGQNRKWSIWNAYNRVPIILQAGDATGSWSYGTPGVRASNNVPSSYTATTFNVGGPAANGATVFCGLSEEQVAASFLQTSVVGTNTASLWKIGIGVNSISVFSGVVGSAQVLANQSNFSINLFGEYDTSTPPLGISILTCLENANSGAAITFDGGSSQMVLRVQYRG